MLRIPADRLREEVSQVFDLILSIKDRVEAGVPGDDIPSADEHQEIYQVQLRGELMLASQRLLALAEVLE